MDHLDQKTCGLLRIIGDPSRFKILQYLMDNPRNVSEIIRAVGMGQPLVSHHLKVLKTHGLLQAIRDGPFVRYSVSCPKIKRIFLLAGEIVRESTSDKGEEL